jgi:acetamidase/formamidase
VTIPVLEPHAGTLHGWFDRDLPPVLTVDPGTTVRFRTLDSGWSAGPHTGGERRRVAEHAPGMGHALTGPVRVRGARPGMVLAVRVDEVVPGPWGTTYAGARPTAWNARLGIATAAVHTWEIDVPAGIARNQYGHSVALRPFLGVMGMPPAEPGRHSTVPPRWHGGNLDCRELVAGSTLYLPIPVDGALFSVGDGHAAQGDGEVSGTAIECNATVTLRFDLQKGRTIPTPQFRTAGPLRPRTDTAPSFAATGHDTDPRAAARAALLGVLDYLGQEHGLTRARACLLASACVDLRISQVVNAGTWTVTAFLPLSIFEGSKV